MENTDTECSPTWETRTQSAVQPGKHGHKAQSNMGNTDTECSPTWETLTQSASNLGNTDTEDLRNTIFLMSLFCFVQITESSVDQFCLLST